MQSILPRSRLRDWLGYEKQTYHRIRPVDYHLLHSGMILKDSEYRKKAKEISFHHFFKTNGRRKSVTTPNLQPELTPKIMISDRKVPNKKQGNF